LSWADNSALDLWDINRGMILAKFYCFKIFKKEEESSTKSAAGKWLVKEVDSF
jgi:hypothetical protein